MNLSFKNRKLKNFLTVDKEIIKTYGSMAKKVKQRIIALEEAEKEDGALDLDMVTAIKIISVEDPH